MAVFPAVTTARAQARAANAQSQVPKQIIDLVEAEAKTYQEEIAEIPITVRQTVRYYDSSGHLKSTHTSSYRYSAGPETNVGGKPGQPASHSPGKEPDGTILSDGVTLPLVFLPGSIVHLSVRAETPATGPWVLHFKSTPCPPPEVRRHWLQANVVSQCVEGEAYLDPKSGTVTRIRMNMGGLPVGFRSLGNPLGVVLLELYNDATFRLLTTAPNVPPLLVPEKARYVTYTTRGRTVVNQTFQPAPAGHKPRGPS